LQIYYQKKKDEWINNLIDQLLFPEIFVLDVVNETDWEFWEQHYISLYESFGYDLFNITSGGKDIKYRNIHLYNNRKILNKEEIKNKQQQTENKKQQMLDYNKKYYKFIKLLMIPYKYKIQLDINLCIQLESLNQNRNITNKLIINKDKYDLIYKFIKQHYKYTPDILYKQSILRHYSNETI